RASAGKVPNGYVRCLLNHSHLASATSVSSRPTASPSVGDGIGAGGLREQLDWTIVVITRKRAGIIESCFEFFISQSPQICSRLAPSSPFDEAMTDHDERQPRLLS